MGMRTGGGRGGGCDGLGRGRTVARGASLAGMLAVALAGAVAGAMARPGPAVAEAAGRVPANPTLGPVPSARVEWGLWLSPDGCEYWIADGYDEGYLVERVDPRDGRPVCHAVDLCLSEPADAMFAPGSAALDPAAAARLAAFFGQGGVHAYGIHVRTDAGAAPARGLALTRRQAVAIGDVARAAGARVGGQAGHGAGAPVAPDLLRGDAAPARRVDILCYRDRTP